MAAGFFLKSAWTSASAFSNPPVGRFRHRRSSRCGLREISGRPSKYSNASDASHPPQLRLNPAPSKSMWDMNHPSICWQLMPCSVNSAPHQPIVYHCAFRHRKHNHFGMSNVSRPKPGIWLCGKGDSGSNQEHHQLTSRWTKPLNDERLNLSMDRIFQIQSGERVSK